MILIASGTANVMLAFTFTDMLVVAAATVDAVLHRRLHPAFVWAGTLVILSHPLRFAVAHTYAWMTFARWLVG